jgi:hypothetical protein
LRNGVGIVAQSGADSLRRNVEHIVAIECPALRLAAVEIVRLIVEV